jgi:hypothetical protein
MWKKVVVASFEVSTLNLSGTQENNEELQSRYPVSRSRFEVGASLIRNKGAIHSNMAFSKNAWSYTSTLPYVFTARYFLKHRDVFIFIRLFIFSCKIYRLIFLVCWHLTRLYEKLGQAILKRSH